MHDLALELAAAVNSLPRSQNRDPFAVDWADIEPAHVEPFAEALEASPELNGFWGKMYSIPGSSMLLESNSAAIYLTGRARSGASPDEIISSLLEIARTRTIHLTDASAIVGIEFDQGFIIENGIELVLPRNLPSYGLGPFLFNSNYRPMQEFGPAKVVLLIKKTINLVESQMMVGPNIAMPLPYHEGFLELEGIKNRVKQAIILNSKASPEIAANWRFVEEIGWPYMRNNGFGSIGHGHRFNIGLANEIQSNIQQEFTLTSITDETVLMALDRLETARKRSSTIEKVIDLGIALELLLMHNDNSKTEITHKLATRGAWLLGEGAADRKIVFQDIKKCYDLRSKAVHAGKLPKIKNLQEYGIQEMQINRMEELVTSLISKLRKGWPNWDSLILNDIQPAKK